MRNLCRGQATNLIYLNFGLLYMNSLFHQDLKLLKGDQVPYGNMYESNHSNQAAVLKSCFYAIIVLPYLP